MSVQLNPKQLADLQKDLQGFTSGQVGRLMVRAINPTARTGRSRFVKRIAAETGLMQKEVRGSIRLNKATFENKAATGPVRG